MLYNGQGKKGKVKKEIMNKGKKKIKKCKKGIRTECHKGKKQGKQTKQTKQAKRLGRPKGSKNKKNKIKGIKGVKEQALNGQTVISNIPKRRGRPKKARYEEPRDEMPPIITVTFKFVGFCPECKVSIGENDFTGYKFTCTGCGTIGGKKELLKEVIRDRPRNKREYMEIYYASYPSTKEKIVANPVIKEVIEKDTEDGEKDIKEDVIEAASEEAPLKTDEDTFFEDNIDGLKE